MFNFVQPHAGGGKGFYFIPEIGEEVWVDFEDQNAERPFVVGSHYNGREKSGFATNDNKIKAIQTRSGHKLIFNEDESIIIADKSGNEIKLDTNGGNIEISAPETVNIKCKNLNIDVSENAKTNIGKNQEISIGENSKTIIGGETTFDSGKKVLISSGQNLEISAKQDLDLYGKQKFIAYTDGKAEIGAKERMHLFGTNSLITAKEKIEYKAPKMNKLPQKGEFKYDKEKQILSVKWMNANMDSKINNACIGEKISVLVHTRNYEEGETISIKIKEKSGKEVKDGFKEITLKGTVNKEGFSVLKEQFEIENSQKEEQEKIEKQRQEEERQANEVYKTYEGKDYTYNEWKVKEQELWEAYQKTKKKK